jgi:putative membrane protein
LAVTLYAGSLIFARCDVCWWSMKLLIRWIVTSVSLFVAAWIVPGIRVAGDGWTVFAVMAVILGLVNATVRPLLKLLSCPLIVVTLGLFVLVINGITLWLAAALAVNWFHVGFYVDGFWAAFLGALIVSIVSVVLTSLVREETRRPS